MPDPDRPCGATSAGQAKGEQGTDGHRTTTGTSQVDEATRTGTTQARAGGTAKARSDGDRSGQGDGTARHHGGDDRAMPRKDDHPKSKGGRPARGRRGA